MRRPNGRCWCPRLGEMMCVECDDDTSAANPPSAAPNAPKRGIDGMFKCTLCDFKTKWREVVTRHLKLKHDVGVALAAAAASAPPRVDSPVSAVNAAMSASTSGEAASSTETMVCAPCEDQEEPKYLPPKWELDVATGKRRCLWDTGGGCVCGKLVGNTKQQIETHWRTHTGARPYKCDYPGCGEAFAQSSHITTHKRTHTRERPFECDWPGCGKAFGMSSNLIIHKRTHTGEKPYECNWPGCGKAFGTSGSLVLHKRTHSGERPYACDHPGCEAAFAQRCDLAKHKRTHTGEKPFVCDQTDCGKAFTQLAHLVSHKRRHTGERPFVCSFTGCEMAFVRSFDLITHKRTHTGERPFECDECDAAFAQSGNLTDHYMRHHNSTYVARKKEQEERVRKAVLNSGWQEYFGGDTLPPPGYFRREHAIDFECVTPLVNGTVPRPPRGKRSKKERKKVKERDDHPAVGCRIDFVLGYDNGFVFLEVDEHQHRFGYRQADGAAISCDAKRMANVQTSITLEFLGAGGDPPPIYWLRYNPHEFRVDGALQRVPKVEREERLCGFLRDLEPRAGIGYAFYDCSEATGLDVLAAEEFPGVLVDMVENLEALVP